MPPVLLRCVESGFVLAPGDNATLSAAEVALRIRGKLAQPAPAVLHLLLPATRCLVTTVQVAQHELKHLQRTLPWMLEERLLEPVEQLHCAHGPATDGVVPVSAINAALLRKVLDELHAAGLQPQSACSDLFLLPWQPRQWTVFLPAAPTEPVLVRHGAHAGFACARANLNTALQLLLNEHGDAPHQVVVLHPESIAHAEVSVSIPLLLQSRIIVQRQTLEQLMHAAMLPACNLLQGSFAPALPWSQWWRHWRVAAVLLVGLFVADIGLNAYESFTLNRQAAALDAEVVALYRSVQPDGAMVDPRLQLEQALAVVGAAGQESFLSLLSRMAPALRAAPGVRVQTLEYDGTRGDLQVQILTSDYAAAENLRAQLRQLGLQAELLGSSSDSGGSRTRLRVGGGA